MSQKAGCQAPSRWPGNICNWPPVAMVTLDPERGGAVQAAVSPRDSGQVTACFIGRAGFHRFCGSALTGDRVGACMDSCVPAALS